MLEWHRSGSWLTTPDYRWAISRYEIHGGEIIYNGWDWYGGPLPEIVCTFRSAEDCKTFIDALSSKAG